MRIRQQPTCKHAIGPLTGRTLMIGLVVLIASSWLAEETGADEPARIWAPHQDLVTDINSPDEYCFRKQFTLIRPEYGELELTTFGTYQLSVNGQLIAKGTAFGKPNDLDISSFLQPGVNLIAISVRPQKESQVGLAARLRVKEEKETRWRALETDPTWKVDLDPIDGWSSTTFSDATWGEAILVASSSVVPHSSKAEQSDEPTDVALANGEEKKTDVSKKEVVTKSETANEQVMVDTEFRVEPVLKGEATGSLLALEFTEFGQLLLSREDGPLLIADPGKQSLEQGQPRVYCRDVESCQGILSLNGEVFVTAMVNGESGLYRLADTNQDGLVEVVQKLIGFTGRQGAVLPGGLRLGQDGMLYVMMEEGIQVDAETNPTSPCRLVSIQNQDRKRQKIDANGGTIIRVSLDGSMVETVAAGIRNGGDLVIDSHGELFVLDGETAIDQENNQAQLTRFSHVPPGATLGKYSDRSKSSDYSLDQTPPIFETEGGTPSGAALYQHSRFPERYYGAIFLADRQQCRILELRTQRNGAGYTAEHKTFLNVPGLNISDLAVGPDGALYFCAGGHDATGGVYRVVSTNKKLDSDDEPVTDFERAIRHDQPGSAWARQQIAELKVRIGDSWGSRLEEFASDYRNQVEHRLHALKLMVFFGPPPSEELLTTLSRDGAFEIRSRIAQLCGTSGGETCTGLLSELIVDQNPMVRRNACESYVRLGAPVPDVSAIISMLETDDFVEAASARRLIERIPSQEWASEVLRTSSPGLFNQGSIALMASDPGLESAYQVLAKGSHFMEGFLNDRDFIGMLRAMELALERGNVDPTQVPALADRIAKEFPTRSLPINRQLIRIMDYLGALPLPGRAKAYLNDSAIPAADKDLFERYLQASIARSSVGEQPIVASLARPTNHNVVRTGASANKRANQVSDVVEENQQEKSPIVIKSNSKFRFIRFHNGVPPTKTPRGIVKMK